MKFFRNKLAVIIVLLSVTFLILIGVTVKRDKNTSIENGIGSTLNKVQGVLYGANSKVNDFFSFVFNFSKIKEQNSQLEAKNANLQSKADDYDELKAENERLQQALNFTKTNQQYDYVGCEIIARGDDLLSSFTINKGTKDGVIDGRVVITQDGIVGQVTEANSSYSIVETLGSANIAIAAYVQGSNDTGIVKGYRDSDNNLMCEISNLPLDSTVKKGDIIKSDNNHFIYPKGVKIGEVVDVQEDASKIMKTATVKPFVNFNKLQEVLIVIPKDKNSSEYKGDEIK
ncbi:rod shape-determining protein MreC [Clostridium sp. 19966]|uniref:rod shape-determining protein MreC n=1 Tax=Clostridium sp. 19966 TaxID=2768166 RepID=UPI0028DE49C1|nr:rod shape-determining protein MreC [Clostridium sp. 19966]MDT8715271.1 rod shape-determining protein MreC [Clostridium sp. 19966]